MAGDLIEQLYRLVLIDKEMMTYKRLCQKMEISCRKSKAVLEEFVKRESGKVDILYVVAGLDPDGNRMFKMLRDSKLEEGKAEFKEVDCTHVYSVAPRPEGTSVETNDLKARTVEVDNTFNQNIQPGHPWSAIVPPEVIISEAPRPTKSFAPPPKSFAPRKSGSMFKKTTQSSKSKNQTIGIKRAAPAPALKFPSKKPKTGLKGFFGRPSAAPSAAGGSKKKKGLMGFFSKKTKKPAANAFNKPTKPTFKKKGKKKVFGSITKAPSKSAVVPSKAPAQPKKPKFSMGKPKPFKKLPVEAPHLQVKTAREVPEPSNVAKPKKQAAKPKQRAKTLEFDDESEDEGANVDFQDAEDEEEYMLKEKKRQENRKKRTTSKKPDEQPMKSSGKTKALSNAGGGKKVKKTRHFVDPDTGMMVTEDIYVTEPG